MVLPLNFIALGLFQNYKNTRSKAIEKIISRTIIFPLIFVNKT